MTHLLDVRIQGQDQDSLRKWRRRRSPAVVALALVGLWAAAWVLPDYSDGSVVNLPSGPVRGSRFAFIWDQSGSMSAQQSVVEERIRILTDEGKMSEPACILSDSEFRDYMGCLDKILQSANTDSVYVFGDFDWFYAVADRDWPRLNSIRQAFGNAPMRFYYETVGMDPPQEFVRFIDDFGGEIIHTRR
jgi:hypothetical protein